MLLFTAIIFYGIGTNVFFGSAYNAKAGTVNGSGCRIRTSPVNGSIITQVNTGFPLTIINEAKQSDGFIWYNVSFSDGDETRTGWIRSDLVNTSITPDNDTSDTDFEGYMTAQGFPNTYKGYLRALHKLHPNWKFKAYNTGLSFSEVIAGETAVVSRNMVQKGNVSSWKSLEDGAYDWDNDTWYEYEKGWNAASKEIIEYCLDPRNFLNDDDNILMFQSLSWNDSETAAGLRNILAPTAMNSEAFVTYFMNAGRTYNVSAYHLAARADQETAGGRSGSVTGTYKNYYNIGAVGANPVQAAVNYAQAHGWDTAEKAIMGGAEFIGGNYISAGQDTLYFQKFDVITEDGNGLYWHQYMGNLIAPQHEATKLAKNLSAYGNNQVTFRIPIYSGMSEANYPLPTADGNPNNFLNSLSVNGYSLTPTFARGVTSYDIIVPEGTTSVNISASPVVGSSKVSGTGTVSLTGTRTVAKVTVTPTYGSPRVYMINITRSGNGGSQNEGGQGGESGGGSGSGGATVRRGDIDGDGARDVLDLVHIKRHIVGLKILTGDQYKAGDINGDGTIDVVDLVMVKRCIVGLISLD